MGRVAGALRGQGASLGRQSFIVQTRAHGRMRKITLGRFPEMGIKQARREAAALLARLWGGEPVPAPRKKKVPLFRDFAARYRERRRNRWKPASLKTFDSYMRNRLMPAFGGIRLDAIDHARVSAWFDAASVDKPGAANRAFEALRAMLAAARQWGELGEHVPDACANIVKNPPKARRALSRPRRARTPRHGPGQAPARAPVAGRGDPAADADGRAALRSARPQVGRDRRVRRGRRQRPARRFQNWDRAPSGSGRRRQGFSRSCPGTDNSGRVFPEDLTSQRLYTFWCGIREEAGLPGLRIHDCRHTWASQGVMNGVGLTTVGRMLGHRNRETTAIYAHLDDTALRDAAALRRRPSSRGR